MPFWRGSIPYLQLPHDFEFILHILPLANPNGKRLRSAKWIIPPSPDTFFQVCQLGDFARTLVAASCNTHISCRRLRQRLHSRCNIKMRATGLACNYWYMYMNIRYIYIYIYRVCGRMQTSGEMERSHHYCAYTMSWSRFLSAPQLAVTLTFWVSFCWLGVTATATATCNIQTPDLHRLSDAFYTLVSYGSEVVKLYIALVRINVLVPTIFMIGCKLRGVHVMPFLLSERL